MNKKEPFNTTQAKKLGITPQLLAYYLKKGLVQRISHGVYRLADQEPTDFESLIKEKLEAIPQGIVGLKTALRLYGLTEELPGEIDIIVPKTNVPKRKLEDVSLYAMKTELYAEEVKKLRGIPVTSIERTFIDLLRTGEPTSLLVNIFQEAKAKRLPISLTKLRKMGEVFRTKAKVAAFIEAVL